MGDNENTTTLAEVYAPPASEAATPRHTAPIAAEPERLEVKLPSGARASVLSKGKGKHVRMAFRMAPGGDQGALMFAMIAVKVRVNGKPLTVEDVDELDDEDVLFLLGKVMGGKGAPSSLPST
jgi:hypothetical protein